MWRGATDQTPQAGSHRDGHWPFIFGNVRRVVSPVFTCSTLLLCACLEEFTLHYIPRHWSFCKTRGVEVTSLCICIVRRGMSIVGFRCAQQVIFEIQRTIYAIEAAQKAPNIFRASVSNSTTLLKIKAKQSLQEINFRLSGLPRLKQLTLKANQSLEETREMILYTQDLIEGFRNTTVVNSDGTMSFARNPCTFLDDFSDEPLSYDTELMVWRIRRTKEESPTLAPEGFHNFPDGQPSRLPNSRKTPTCSTHQFFSSIYSSTERSCPCCRDCLVFHAAIQDTLNGMPTMEDLENLNTPVPFEWVGEDIDQLMREMDRAVQLVDAWLKNVNIGLNGIKFGLRTLLTFMSVAHPDIEICNCA